MTYGSVPGCGNAPVSAHEFDELASDPFTSRRLRMCRRCGVIEVCWGKGRDRRAAYHIPMAVAAPEGT